MTSLFCQSGAIPVRWHQGTACEHAALAICISAVVLFGLLPGILFDLIGRILPCISELRYNDVDRNFTRSLP